MNYVSSRKRSDFCRTERRFVSPGEVPGSRPRKGERVLQLWQVDFAHTGNERRVLDADWSAGPWKPRTDWLIRVSSNQRARRLGLPHASQGKAGKAGKAVAGGILTLTHCVGDLTIGVGVAPLHVGNVAVAVQQAELRQRPGGVNGDGVHQVEHHVDALLAVPSGGAQTQQAPIGAAAGAAGPPHGAHWARHFS